MKAYECRRNIGQPPGDLQWQIMVAEDGGEWRQVQPVRVYATEEECELEMLRLDAIENGSL